MKLKPFRSRILAQAEDSLEKTSESGLVLVKDLDTHPKAKVLAIGPGTINKKGVRIKVSIKPDDIILYDPKSAKTITVDEAEFIVLKEDDIVAVVDE